MGTSIVNLLPEHQRLLADPQMVRTMVNRSIVRHGEDAIFAWMARSDENFGKGLSIGARLAPKEVNVSGSIGVEAYYDAIDAAGGNDKVIEGDFEIVETEKKESSVWGLFFWPDCFFVDMTSLPAQA